MATSLHQLQERHLQSIGIAAELILEAVRHQTALIGLESTPELPSSPNPAAAPASPCASAPSEPFPSATRGEVLGHLEDLEGALETGDLPRCRQAVKHLRLAFDQIPF